MKFRPVPFNQPGSSWEKWTMRTCWKIYAWLTAETGELKLPWAGVWKSKNEWNLDENKKLTETPREENGEMMTWWTKPFSPSRTKTRANWPENETEMNEMLNQVVFSCWGKLNQKHRWNEWNFKIVCCFLLAGAPKNRARGFSPSPQNEKFLLWWIFSLPQKRKIVVVMSYDDGPYE